MKFTRTIKNRLTSPKWSWKPKEFELESICMPNITKEERPMIIWSQNYPDFSDTMCFDYDNLKPSEFMVNLLYLTKLDQDSIYKCVMAVMESSSGNTHVLVKVDNKKLRPSNYKKIYKSIAEELGSNFDQKCSDLFRGFFAPNRIVYTNFSCVSYAYNPKYHPLKQPSQGVITDNVVSFDNSNSEIGEFVKGNRNHFIFRTLLKMVKDRGDVGHWMEEFAYGYAEEDFPKEEIDKIIEYLRRTNRKFKRIRFLSQHQKNKYERNFGEYRQLRIEGKNHQEAFTSLALNLSIPTTNRYRARYNKEFGINERRGGKIGRAWKRKKIVDNNNTITKEAV